MWVYHVCMDNVKELHLRGLVSVTIPELRVDARMKAAALQWRTHLIYVAGPSDGDRGTEAIQGGAQSPFHLQRGRHTLGWSAQTSQCWDYSFHHRLQGGLYFSGSTGGVCSLPYTEGLIVWLLAVLVFFYPFEQLMDLYNQSFSSGRLAR